MGFSTIAGFLASYWWILVLIFAVILYKPIFRLFGVVIVPKDKIGLVTKKFVLWGPNSALSGDRIIAVNGEAGYQAKTLSPGVHYFKWPWQYDGRTQSFVSIPE